ncbi:erythropoietin isoform X2 [Hyperolius riggenbachi]|uniref:erythropoietin isoform X2 n=1 Tax=Hyperolius riggenbachi TaxID=752182 RepID=UPI0035A3586D
MGVTDLLILLQMLLVNVKLVTPQPMCDRRVLNNYITAATDEDNVMNVACDFPEDVILPEPSMNMEWRKLQISQQRAEVQQGITLFINTVPTVTKFLSDCHLQLSLQKFSSRAQTMKNILDRINVKADVNVSDRQGRTFAARTLKQFYAVYKNFLQGKYRAFMISACAQNR